MKTGLTLGKFAPLHKGHQFLIEQALSEVDKLFILIYATDVTLIPLKVRAGWIRELYPQVVVIECPDGPDGVSTERDFEILQENYILKQLNGQTITHFYSSEFYGQHVSLALKAIDRRVDEARQYIPISATLIRSNPYHYRQYMSPIVYRDLITKVVFLGAMSTGKSTITKAAAKRFKTTYVEEYGREYWEKNQISRRLRLDEFDHIATEHIRREDDAALSADHYLFIDTNAITTYMFCLDYHGQAPELLTRLAEQNSTRYDIVFLCEDDIPYDNTWDRSGDQKRQVFHRQIKDDLAIRRIPYIPLTGSLEERLTKVQKVLTRHKKFANSLAEHYITLLENLCD